MKRGLASVSVFCLVAMIHVLLAVEGIEPPTPKCDPEELKPCGEFIGWGQRPSAECCNKLTKQELCLCIYADINSPKYTPSLRSPNGLKVIAACGINYPIYPLPPPPSFVPVYRTSANARYHLACKPVGQKTILEGDFMDAKIGRFEELDGPPFTSLNAASYVLVSVFSFKGPSSPQFPHLSSTLLLTQGLPIPLPPLGANKGIKLVFFHSLLPFIGIMDAS
ncbi:hypothetical protein BUALT_Bualt04G0083500 [Buddleja alternifolia]|uniref:Bifunctional inhibitor/plant lipid transfer protein/seed storage helical domain-containing protein n=1 Tax=Buddleja alternifolia TaxID=168488 RepID=A0AAV6XU06_9LAMI|nr:hypothetical protein BUALT_Bualt04G0083500 [Buddleja alternifolia]